MTAVDMVPYIIRPIRYLSSILARITEVAVVVLSLIMIGSLLAGVLFRYFLHSPLSWSGEVALLSFSWIVLLAATLGVREGFHVRVTALHNILPSILGALLHRVILLLMIGFGVILTVTGYRLGLLTLGQRSPAVGYPLWLLNAGVPVCGGLISIHALVRFLISGRVDDERE